MTTAKTNFVISCQWQRRSSIGAAYAGSIGKCRVHTPLSVALPEYVLGAIGKHSNPTCNSLEELFVTFALPRMARRLTIHGPLLIHDNRHNFVTTLTF